MLKKLGPQRLVALFCVALLALNYPLLALWNLDTLFSLWAVLIGVLAWLLEYGDD